MIFTDDEVARSLASAAMLVLAGFSAVDDWNRFADFAYTTQEVRRKLIADAEQEFALTYGPESETWLIPGIVCEYAHAEETRGKRILDVILSVSREIHKTIEVEQSRLAQFTVPLYDLIYNIERCPIYSFDWDSTAKNESITDIKGFAAWHQATMRLTPPHDRVVGERRMGGWLRREFHFQVRFTNYEISR